MANDLEKQTKCLADYLQGQVVILKIDDSWPVDNCFDWGKKIQEKINENQELLKDKTGILS